jgi:methylated-DNA-[protein]-cysteine S-methyltransferase
MMNLTFGELAETPIGPLSFIAGDEGIRRLAFMRLKQLKADGKYQDDEPSLKGLETIGTLINEVNEFLFGIRKDFSIDVDWHVAQGFESEVLEEIYQIPYGEVLTYGEVAKRLGKPNAARAVGRALSMNPIPIVIPCHRVIGADRRLVGYTAPEGLKTKTFLLQLEGHRVEGDRVTE